VYEGLRKFVGGHGKALHEALGIDEIVRVVPQIVRKTLHDLKPRGCIVRDGT
jgi:hypothetical protein